MLRTLLLMYWHWLTRLPVSEDDDGDAFSLLGRRPNALLRDPCEKMLHVRIEVGSSESRLFREVEATSKRAIVMPIKFIQTSRKLEMTLLLRFLAGV